MTPLSHHEAVKKLLEELLKKKVQQAQVEYESAKVDFEIATAHLEDLGHEHPDGRVALRNAVVTHNRARGKLKRAMQDLNRFILDDKLPL